MDINKLINGWHLRAQNLRDDYFAKFVFEYLAFIAFLNRDNRYNFSDRRLIQELKRDSVIRQSYLAAIDQTMLHELIKILDEEPIVNVTNQADKWWDCATNDCGCCKSGNDGKLMGVDDYANMIEFIYRARNNLFHGKKGPDINRDEIIVKYGYALLKPLVGILISYGQYEEDEYLATKR